LRSGFTLILAAALSAGLGTALAQWSQWDSDFDEERKPWKEIESRIPANPRASDLIPFDVGNASPHRFHIDARSLSVGEDGVVRYTLVVVTAGGARNVTYEGIHCKERAQKYYAVGQPDGRWGRARNPQWRRIESVDINAHHYVLYNFYVCSSWAPVASVREIVERLKSGPPFNPAGG
jgi:hypothetical protein